MGSIEFGLGFPRGENSQWIWEGRSFRIPDCTGILFLGNEIEGVTKFHPGIFSSFNHRNWDQQRSYHEDSAYG